MAAPRRRNVWVDHWTLHQDVAELREEATHTNPTPDIENNSVPRYGDLSSSQDGFAAVNDTVLSTVAGKRSNAVQAGQGHYFGVTRGENKVPGLGYTDTADKGQYAMEAPIAPKATRNQLEESRWATAPKAKGLAIWRDPPKQFVKANSQSLMSETSNNTSAPPGGNANMPPHLRQVPSHTQQNASKPEPQQQLDLTREKGIQHDVHQNKIRDELPVRSALPHNASRFTTRKPAGTSVFQQPPVSTHHNKEIAAPNTAQEASLAVFGVDPPVPDPDGDPRGAVPIQIYEDQDWDATRRPKKKSFESESVVNHDSEVSATTSVSNWAPANRMTEWIGKWVERVPDSVETDVLKDRPNVYEDYDVDCESGKILAQVQQPRTTLNPHDKTSLNPRRRLATSHGYIVRERKKREEEERIRIQLERQEKARLAPPQINEETEPAMTRMNPFQCRAECHIRPAEVGDMVAVANLYNQEVESGWRALDQDAVHPPSWGQILRHCHEHKLPFVVALSGYRDPSVPVVQAGHRIVGFAFLDVAGRGVLGSVKTNAKCSGRLYVMVDPQHRRVRIGTALMDAVLRAVSPQYTPKEHTYQWENPRQDSTYFECREKLHSEKRQWCSILMEVYVQNQGTKENTTKGEEYQFVWNWLEMDLDMNLISHAPMSGRADRLPTSPLLDRMIFEHRCCPAEILV